MSENPNPYQSPQVPGDTKQGDGVISRSDTFGIALTIVIGALLSAIDWGTDQAIGGHFIVYNWGPTIGLTCISGIVTAWTYFSLSRGKKSSVRARWATAICLSALIATMACALTGAAGDWIWLKFNMYDLFEERHRNLWAAGGLSFVLVTATNVGLYCLFKISYPLVLRTRVVFSTFRK